MHSKTMNDEMCAAAYLGRGRQWLDRRRPAPLLARTPGDRSDAVEWRNPSADQLSLGCFVFRRQALHNPHETTFGCRNYVFIGSFYDNVDGLQQPNTRARNKSPVCLSDYWTAFRQP